MAKRDYKNELLIQSEIDKSTRLMVDKNFLENIDKINRECYCIFLCKCGIKGKKRPRDALGEIGKNNGSGLFCLRCTEINRNKKMNKKNAIDNKLLKLCIRWWLVKTGKRYTNKHGPLGGWSKEETLNICRIEYERNGISALIPKNLNSLPGCSVYSTYIRKYIKEEKYQEEFKLSHRGNQNQKTPGYPDIYICEQLGLVDQRKEYLKNTFPCETDTFEEMCEIHIKPFLDNYIKNISINGFILTEHIFYNNNRCDIKGGLKKHKKGINEVRQYFKLNKNNLESLRKDSEGYYERRNSKAEIVFDNFIVLYSNLTNENVEWEVPYPQDFIDKYDKKCKSDCKITIDDKIIIVEIWNFSPDNIKNIGNQKNRYEDYLEWRKIKEDYWKTKKNIIFIGIDHDKLYCNQNILSAVKYCKEILSQYIDIFDVSNQVDCNVFPKNDYNLMMDDCRDYFIKNDNKLYDDLPNKILKIIRKTYGNMTDGLNVLRNILHNEISDNNWKEKYISTKSSEKLQKIQDKIKQTNNNKSPEELQKIQDKIKQTNNNKSPEEKKLIGKKISDARNNFSPGKKEKIRKKQKKTIEEKGLNKGEKNSMYGKRGKDNPNYGSKQPRHTKQGYIDLYAPLICKFLESLNEGDKINADSNKWREYSKTTIMPLTPWNNKPDYNPWYETKWIGFIETGIEYATKNNIVLPEFKYKNVVSSDKRNQKKDYNEEDVWNIHIDFIKYCDGNKIEKNKRNADKYFRDKKFIMTLSTLISKNNKNSEIFGTSYNMFLEKTENKAAANKTKSY